MVKTLEARREAVVAALQQYEGPSQRRVSVPLKGGFEVLPVVKIAVADVVLNPNSHRIRAQLLSHPKAGLIEKDPFSEEAQEAIAEVIEQVADKFEALKSDLAEDGQREHGVITRDGVLINANTRVVALRQLGKEYVDVAVLPDGTQESDHDEIEAHLQVALEHKSDYTFTNQLLWVQLWHQKGLSKAAIAKRLGYTAGRSEKKAVEMVTDSLEMLALIEDLRSRSEGRLVYTEFDADKQTLTDLVAALRSAKSEEERDEIRESRLATLLTGASYAYARKSDANFWCHEVPDALEDSASADKQAVAAYIRQETEKVVDKPDNGDDLDLLEDDEIESEVGPRAVVALLVDASVAKDDPVEIRYVEHDEDGTSREVTATLTGHEVLEILNNAAEEVGEARTQAEKHARKLVSPAQYLREATAKVDKAKEALKAAKDLKAFDTGKLGKTEQRARQVKKALDELCIELDNLRDEFSQQMQNGGS